MDDIRDFYILISPLVKEDKFCMDQQFSFTNKSHPKCGSCPQKFLAGIKKENNSFKTFIKKDYAKLKPNNNDLYLLILIFMIMFLKVN